MDRAVGGVRCTRRQSSKGFGKRRSKCCSSRKLRERFKDLGQEVGQPLTSNEMSAGLRSDSARVGEVLRSVNYKPE